MGANLSAHLETANKTGVFTLTDKGILKVPPEVQRLQNSLRNIDVSGNKLTSLPDFLASFVALKQLTLNRNRFVEFPVVLCAVPKLEVLNMEGCGLKALPENIGECAALKRLSLADNVLTALPPGIGKLAKLETLNVSANQLASLPDEIGDLTITELLVSRNQLASLPAGMARSKSLKVVKAEENCLEDGSIPLVIFGDSNISSLALEGNPIDLRKLHHTPEWEKYMERYTKTQNKKL